MRLEPSEYLPDVGAFFTLSVFPHPVLFWDPKEDTLLRHRNPLLSGTIAGLSPLSCTVDTLHCLYLVLFNAFVSLILWTLIDLGHFARGSNQDEIVANSLTVIKSRLNAWYRARHSLARREKMTRVHEFTSKMLGDKGAGKVKTKGAETWGVLLWLLKELESKPNVPALARLAAGVRSLEEMVLVWSHGSWKLTPMEIQTSYDCFNRFVAMTDGLEELEIPKRHMAMHLIRDLAHYGNPRWYANWTNESLNRVLKNACRQVSQLTFEVSVLSAMRWLRRNKRRT